MQGKRFKIVVAKNLSEKQREAVDGCLVSIIKWLSSDGWKCRRESGAFLRRGILGYTYSGLLEVGITFKRLSKHRLIFGFVRFEDLDIILPCQKGCQCAMHLGGLKAVLKDSKNIDRNFTVLYDGHGVSKWAEAKES